MNSFCYVKKKQKRNYYKDDAALKRIGERIREIRIEKQISQESFANESEFDYSQLNRMELGKVNFNISNLYRIAKALNVNAKDLLE